MRIGHWQLQSKCGDFLFADVDPAVTDRAWKVGRSLWSLRELHRQLLDAAGITGWRG